MRRKDHQYQEAVEAEIERISASPLDWIYKLPFGSRHRFTYEGKEFEGGLCHFDKDMGYENHSLVLFLERKVFFGVYKKYMAGFSFNKNEILEIPKEIIESCD
ncbi:hypothetical protein NBRC116583_38970 [Arenicella sp. 4NH20-0111]|uniref:hypothetical protein n=1 Tax=Arenicella sp. 4NH20-0111 TaxID=3127648 RepID=UPI00310C0CC7